MRLRQPENFFNCIISKLFILLSYGKPSSHKFRVRFDPSCIVCLGHSWRYYILFLQKFQSLLVTVAIDVKLLLTSALPL